MPSRDDKRRRRERDRKTGRPKPRSCEGCGAVTARLERHHDDYVGGQFAWLCRECHADRHYLRMDIEPTQFCNLFKGTDAAEHMRHGAHLVNLMLEADPYSWPPAL